jgi:L-cysteine S-thiosulfotransferase
MRSLFILGLLLTTSTASVRAEIPPQERRSGFDFMAPQTQAMQNDDTGNPGMLWVLDGERLWQQPAGKSAAACSGCHGDATKSMRGVAARFPAFDAKAKRPIDLATQINRCRKDRQSVEPFALESNDMLALTAYVAYQSRGMRIEPPNDARLKPFSDNGRQWFNRRIGQLQLSCASCHDDNWGKQLGGNRIPQGHPTAYPLYRLEWQSLGSVQRRLRNCLTGVRAETLAFGSPELIDIELYLMSRAAGMTIETPGVRP